MNERIPVSEAALEAHWDIDCKTAWSRLINVVHRAGVERECEAPAGLREELALCGFVYQPPGEGADNHCPDYRAAVKLIDSAHTEGFCTALSEFLAGQEGCPAPARGRSNPE